MTKILDVRVNGRNIDVYTHQGKSWIEGRKNSEYTLLIKNPYNYKVKAVISIDGISVLDGEPASKKSKGYLIPAYGSYEVTGWRVSDSLTRAFKFSDVEQSYSSKSGNGDANTGVIGVRFYLEKLDSFNWYVNKPWTNSGFSPTYQVWFGSNHMQQVGSGLDADTLDGLQGSYYNASYNTGDSVRSLSATAKSVQLPGVATMDWYEPPQAEEKLATGQGSEIESHTREVQFSHYENHCEEQLIFYDTRKGLEKRGVIMSRANHNPSAFPGDGYCKSF